MKAIIMAGGEGTRLRPLTCDCPKPMMQMMNRPVMEYAIGLLKDHNITQIAVTLGYLPDAVTDFFADGADHGISLKYYIERTPMGTAGGVGRARDFLDETFIVLSGDGLTDLDITAAVGFHRRKNALATLVLKTVEEPFEYGVVMTDEDGRVTGFIEKPDPSNVFSASANTGIYILEPEIFDHIPADRPYDFGGELFPALVRAGLPVFGYRMEGYWCDIGDVDAYIRAHADAMEGRVSLPGLRPDVSEKARIHPSAVLEGPVSVAPGAQIGENAYIGPYSVIGPGCVIGIGASVKRSILWNDVRVDPGAQARGCVLASGCRLRSGAQVYESAVLGPGADLGERAVVMPGVKLWPGKHAAPGARVGSNLVWGSGDRLRFSGGTLPISQPSQAMLAAQAHVSVFKPRALLLGRADSPIANVMWHAAAAGAMAQGVQVMDCGPCPLPVLRHAMKALGCDGGALVTDDRFIPLQPTGASLTGRQQRALLALYARQDFPKPFSAAPSAIVSAGAPVLSYMAEACRRFAAPPEDAPAILLFCRDRALSQLALSVLDRAGLKARTARDSRAVPAAHELGLHLGPGGESFSLSDREGPLSEAQQQLFSVWTALNTGARRVLLPVSATRAARTLAGDIPVEYVGGEPSAWQNALAERFPDQFTLHFDGLQAALTGLSLLTAQGLTLRDWRGLMPDACRQKRRVPTSSDAAGHILETFARSMPDSTPDCGVRFTRDGGWAWVCPEENMRAFRVVTESVSAETARELCDFCEKEILRLSKK